MATFLAPIATLNAGGGVTQEKNATIIFQESRVIFQESRVTQEKNATRFYSRNPGPGSRPSQSEPQPGVSLNLWTRAPWPTLQCLPHPGKTFQTVHFSSTSPACHASVTEVPRSEAELPRGSLHWLCHGFEHHCLGLLGPHWLCCPRPLQVASSPIILLTWSFVRDLCSSAGILASALVTFTVMFLPKGRQMALGKDNKVEVGLASLLHQFSGDFFAVLQPGGGLRRLKRQSFNPLTLLWQRRFQ